MLEGVTEIWFEVRNGDRSVDWIQTRSLKNELRFHDLVLDILRNCQVAPDNNNLSSHVLLLFVIKSRTPCGRISYCFCSSIKPRSSSLLWHNQVLFLPPNQISAFRDTDFYHHEATEVAILNCAETSTISRSFAATLRSFFTDKKHTASPLHSFNSYGKVVLHQGGTPIIDKGIYTVHPRGAEFHSLFSEELDWPQNSGNIRPIDHREYQIRSTEKDHRAGDQNLIMTHQSQPNTNYGTDPPESKNWTQAYVKNADPYGHKQAVNRLFSDVHNLVTTYGLTPSHYQRHGVTSRTFLRQHRVWVTRNAFPANYQALLSIANQPVSTTSH